MALTDWYCEDVLSGKLVVRKVFEDDRVLAFHHPRPTRPVHVVVIPKTHVPSLLDENALDGELLLSMLKAIQHTARTLGLDVPQENQPGGFSVRANVAAPGVTPHMHWHILAPGVKRKHSKSKFRQ